MSVVLRDGHGRLGRGARRYAITPDRAPCPSAGTPETLEQLGTRGIHHALLEGGPTLASAFLRAGLMDEIIAYLAPALLGAGRSAIGDLGIDTIDKAVRLRIPEVVLLGGDVRITATTATQSDGGA